MLNRHDIWLVDVAGWSPIRKQLLHIYMFQSFNFSGFYLTFFTFSKIPWSSLIINGNVGTYNTWMIKADHGYLIVTLNFIFMYKALPLIEHLPKYKRGRDIRHSISEGVFIMKWWSCLKFLEINQSIDSTIT